MRYMLIAAMMAGCGSEPITGCTKDTDCRDPRVCVNGACVDVHAEIKADMSSAADLAVAVDMASTPDLAVPDMSIAADMTKQPDLTQPDLVTPADLWMCFPLGYDCNDANQCCAMCGFPHSGVQPQHVCCIDYGHGPCANDFDCCYPFNIPGTSYSYCTAQKVCGAK